LIWAGGWLLKWLAPETLNTLRPGHLDTLIFLLVFCATLLDWTTAAVESRLRPRPHDLTVIALIALLPFLAFAERHQTKTIYFPVGISKSH
jgi:hypothetical protein